MIELLYFASLVLMLPIAALATFGALLDSLAKFGLWSVIKVLFAPLYDPFGRGLWVLLFVLGLLGICAAGLFPQARPYGFGAIITGIAGCSVYVFRSFPQPWEPGSILFFVPGSLGIAIGVYSFL